MQFHFLILRTVLDTIVEGSTFMSVLDMASGFYQVGVRVMALNEFQQYFSYIMASVLLVEETRVPGQNHRPVANHQHILSHNVVSSTPRH